MTEWPTASPVVMGQASELAFSLADAFVLTDLENLPMEPQADGTPVTRSDVAWRDTRPLLDEREHAPQVIDMMRVALYYADLRRLIARHPTQPHLVRITNRRGT